MAATVKWECDCFVPASICDKLLNSQHMSASSARLHIQLHQQPLGLAGILLSDESEACWVAAQPVSHVTAGKRIREATVEQRDAVERIIFSVTCDCELYAAGGPNG